MPLFLVPPIHASMADLTIGWPIVRRSSGGSADLFLPHYIRDKFRITITCKSTFMKSLIKESQIRSVQLNVLTFQVFKKSGSFRSPHQSYDVFFALMQDPSQSQLSSTHTFAVGQLFQFID